MTKSNIFLDIEANQDITKHPIQNDILQIGAIKIHADGKISKFNEYVKYNKEINKKVKYIIKKDEKFFKNKKLSEFELLKRFISFCKGCKLYSYGSYDEKVFKEALKRTRFNTNLKIIDMSTKILETLNIKK